MHQASVYSNKQTLGKRVDCAEPQWPTATSLLAYHCGKPATCKKSIAYTCCPYQCFCSYFQTKFTTSTTHAWYGMHSFVAWVCAAMDGTLAQQCISAATHLCSNALYSRAALHYTVVQQYISAAMNSALCSNALYRCAAMVYTVKQQRNVKLGSNWKCTYATGTLGKLAVLA